MNKVLLEVLDRTAIVTMNRPEKRNALNHEVRSDLYAVLKEIDSREEIRVGIITGAGEAFVAGADIAAMKDYDPDDAREASKHGSDLFLFLENMRIPMIAAINGWALGGGCELALACDLRLCADTAVLGQPEVTVGIIPGYGANVRLPRLIGPARAKELIYTGRLIDAAEAHRIGLVHTVVPKEDLMKEAMKLARRLAKGPASISFAKQAINKAFDMEIGQAMEFASALYGEVYKTRDAKEGISAYLEKRKPGFIGK
jgi:enoyl-CoA hydratase